MSEGPALSEGVGSELFSEAGESGPVWMGVVSGSSWERSKVGWQLGQYRPIYLGRSVGSSKERLQCVAPPKSIRQRCGEALLPSGYAQPLRSAFGPEEA